MVFSVGTPALAQPISAAELQKRIAQAVEKKFTGIASISFLTGEEMQLFMRQGEVRQVYFNNGHDPFRRFADPWIELVISGRLVRLTLQPMPARRLLFEKAILEIGENGQDKKKLYKTAELPGLFGLLEQHASATLLRIRWQNAEAFVLIPGSKILSKPAAFNSAGITEEDGYALSNITNWSEPKCEVIQYHGGLETDAWIELHLNILFEWYCNHLLAQYGFLTGKVMVTAAVQNLIIYALQSGWEVVRNGDKLVDQTIFNSPAEAAHAYGEMLAVINEHLLAMIGSTLIQSIKRQGLNTLNTFYQTLIKTYSLFV
jgi:hypothetical protein